MTSLKPLHPPPNHIVTGTPFPQLVAVRPASPMRRRETDKIQSMWLILSGRETRGLHGRLAEARKKVGGHAACDDFQEGDVCGDGAGIPDCTLGSRL
jgi:hypothetical protein